MSTVLAGCVFTAPPALPEEVAELEAEKAARISAVNGGTLGAGGTASPEQFTAGEEPRLGMNQAEMQAYATAQGDPEKGDFTLVEALAGMTGEGTLWALIEMTTGDIECELFEAQAPLTVANFVGLARGLRATRDDSSGEWAAKPYYNKSEFHRAIAGFMVQGGDPTGTGRGSTGYVIADELDPQLRHDVAGRLSMANRGPGTGSGQFFVTLGPTTHLDGKHTIFGQCTERSIQHAEDIAATAGPGDHPSPPAVMQRVTIVRR